MFIPELKRGVLSIINENDPHKASKKLQLDKWCDAFSELFSSAGANYLTFFLDILSDEECWQETDTIHRIKLNRRLVAKKIVQTPNFNYKYDPLDDYRRFQIACWCCLEEDILYFFEHFKQIYKLHDTAEIRRFVRTSKKATYSDDMMKYWLNIMTSNSSELEGRSSTWYAYGLGLSLRMKKKHVEAVEYFWNKIKSFPDEKLTIQQKRDIFINTAVRAGSHCWLHPEIFEFCISEISPDTYSEILERDLEENVFFHSSLGALQDMNRFDLIQRLFDCFEPNDISVDIYWNWLTFLEMENYSDHYVHKATELFLHIWTKEGFDRHRDSALTRISDDSDDHDNFLVRFVKNNCMEPVWAVLGKASPLQIQSFMSSEAGYYIQSILSEKQNLNSLHKLLSYAVLRTVF